MRRLAITVLLAACGAPAQVQAPRAAAAPSAPRAHAFASCGPAGRIESAGQPFSDDLSGLAIDGELLWTHTDARRATAVIEAFAFSSPGERVRTVELDGPAIDPEDLARSPDGLLFLADIGDNSGAARCYRYVRQGAQRCVLDSAVEGVESEEHCTSVANRLWIVKTLSPTRAGPYRIWHIGPDFAPIARLEWSHYPHDADGRCGGIGCGTLALTENGEANPSIGRFDAEAIFARRERYADGTIGTSLYVLTKATHPLSALTTEQQGEQCSFEADGLALLFRLSHVERMRDRVDVGPELELLGTLDLSRGEALGARVTGATFEGNDLVVTTRASLLRWHVPSDVMRIDQRFLDAHPPCLAEAPPLATAPKMEGVALGALSAEGARTYFLISEEGDWAYGGAEGLFRVEQRWSYEGAVFVRGDVDANGAIDGADAELLGTIVRGEASARCADAADVNDDGRIDAGDIEALRGARAGAICTRDETPDALTCTAYASPCARNAH